MFSFVALTNLILLASCVFAAPASHNATSRSLLKRDAVCGADFRTLVSYDDCVPKKVAYTLKPPSTIVETKFSGKNNVPSHVQCDHAVELQLLDWIAKQSGLCDVLAALVAADPKLKKAKLLDPAAQHISSLPNLNFLDASVNNQKKIVIQRALNGKSQGSSGTDRAVGNYLAKVKTDTRKVAATLDKDIAAIIKQAENILKGLPDGSGDRDKATVAKRNLKKALDDYDDELTVAEAWSEVLSEAPHT